MTPATSGPDERSASTDADGTGEDLVSGYGVSPGIVSGTVRVIETLDQLDEVGEGDIIVTKMTTPDMISAMQRSGGIVTDEGGMTSHASIISRELGITAVVGTGSATSDLESGWTVTVDGGKGAVREGRARGTQTQHEKPEERRPESPVKPMTATEVKVNISIPEAAERAAATGADGVGLLRLEHILLSTNKTSERYVEDHGEDAYITEIVDGIHAVAREFYPRPVRVRTLDCPTDELRHLEGGDGEPHEHNPMLGYRGIRRSFDEPEMLQRELRAFKRLYEMGYDNLEIMIPLANDKREIQRARGFMEAVGIDPERRTWGAMVETPACALGIEEIAACGIDFASFGTNDLIQFTLAVDRNNETIADRFDALHPSVLKLISRTIDRCQEHDVATSIAGQAGSQPEMVEFLVDKGISSISANIDAVRDVQRQADRVEQQRLLDAARHTAAQRRARDRTHSVDDEGDESRLR